MARAAKYRRWRSRGAIPGFAAAVFAAMLHAAAAQTVVVDSAACRALTVHQPAPDVAYRPGVDAMGRAVPPADLGGAPQPSPLARNFVFDLNADLRPYLRPGSALFQPQLSVGRVSVAPDGTVLFNGQPLGQADRAALAAACRQPPR
jgi:hypothetical protein